LTATNMTVGTVAYAAPEQLMGAEIDGRADQYALAATAFHLLTGAPPYQHSNPVAVISQHLNSPPPKLSNRRPDLAHLDQVLSKALAKDPAERFSRCREFALTLSDVAANSLNNRVADPDITVQAPRAGTETQVAVVRAPGGLVQPRPHQLRRSDSDPIPTARRTRGRRRLVLLAATATVAVTIVGLVSYWIKQKDGATSDRADLAVLDGTYRLDYDNARQTSNGAPNSQPNTDNVSWWAFRSSCRSHECVATGTKLDTTNHQLAITPAVRSAFHFVDGNWHEAPAKNQTPQNQCLGAAGKEVAPGQETQTSVRSFKPQPDGTFQGIHTVTVLTNECGDQGQVLQVPLVGTRVGEVPPSVTVADPATVTTPPTTSTPQQAAAGPVLNGVYRLDFDNSKQTVDGAPTTGGSHKSYWWAFRTLCASNRCVATGASLDDANHQEPTGDATRVFYFVDGHWQDTPYLRKGLGCPQAAVDDSTTYAETISWSLELQADGKLRGIETATVLTNECGKQGMLYKTPLEAARAEDVPPNVVLADPALFLALPVPVHQLSGHYDETETYPDGHQVHSDWNMTPCGDGCVSIADLGQAHLSKGQWTLDGSGSVTCEQGGDTPNAIGFHYSWDPVTLAGSVKITNNEQVCGNPAGYQVTNNLQLALAP
jgi:serine/threonine protein kinase, bacterial